jgi:2-polyprenyl-3-methyl-5-hydroxy-6-metoxy-1,4-benzoquinol methylase
MAAQASQEIDSNYSHGNLVSRTLPFGARRDSRGLVVAMNSPVFAAGELLDPVAAYDRVAPVYAHLAAERRAYLDAIDRIVVSGIPPGSRSLLDVGAGDGARAGRIAAAAGLRDLILLEPSGVMRSHCPAQANIWAMRAEDLHCRQGSFDAITCLWNVLGHILPTAARSEVLRQFARLVSAEGRIFIDLNHRYNARHYGALATAVRFLRDRVSPADGNGDVRVTWNIEGHRVSTAGHVFTHREFSVLSETAGLRIEQRFVVDYASGQLQRRSCEGNLVYVLRRS